MNVKLVVILIMTSLVGLFIIQNVAIVEIQFLFWSIRMPRSLLMILLLAIGMLMGWLLHAHTKHRKEHSE